MKKMWEEPKILVQKFMPNEYVAACGDTEYGNYLFECDAPAGATHEAPTTGDFYDGFVDRNGNRRQDSGEGVIVWRNREWSIFGWRWNGHATTNLDMESWTKDRS